MNEPLFVYDALLSPSYLSTLAPDARFICTGTAPGWQLEFDAVAFMVPHADASVFGALYNLPAAGLRALDRTRGAEHDRAVVVVATEREKELTAQAYVAAAEIAARLPSARPTARYFEAIERGYSVHNAGPTDWDALRAAMERARA